MSRGTRRYRGVVRRGVGCERAAAGRAPHDEAGLEDGVLTFQGRSYPLSIGGLSYGFTFGASETHFHGTVSNIRSPSDVAGVYAQGGAGAAAIKGAQAVVLANQSGAVLTLTGEQNGVIVSLDLSGLALSLK